MGLPLRPPGFGENRQPVPEQTVAYSLDLGYNRAIQLLKGESSRMDDFRDLYGDTNVNRDLNRVKELKDIFEKNNTKAEKESSKLATILETLIHEQINISKWFGPNARSLRPSEFDDYINGIDGIIEFRYPNAGMAFLGLGIDVTYTQELDKKFARIKEELDSGKLAEIKYLKSSDSSLRGKVTDIPRVVVGADGETASDLARAWFKKNPALKNDRFRIQLLLEIQMQLETFSKYAERRNNVALQKKFKEALVMVQNILKQIGPNLDTSFAQKDKVFQAIKKHLEEFEVFSMADY